MKRTLYILLLCACASIAIFAQVPEGYYNSAYGKKDAALKTALFVIIKNPSFYKNKYFNARDFFGIADRTSDGYIWDMYSTIRLTSWTGTGTNALNREHNMPKSWFGIAGGNEDSESIGCDYNNLYPSNASANSRKSNYPLGETNAARKDDDAGKVGASRLPKYSGTVYEPAEEYKGDFARNYMYMVTCYEDYANRWTNTSMLQNNTYPVFNAYAIELLMRWTRQDTVSTKERKRNNEVYKIQHNRNPFVDFPVLAEYIWGDYKGLEWNGKNTERKNFYISYNRDDKNIFVSIDNPEAAEYQIYNFSDIKIQSGKLDENSKIDVSQLKGGMYILLVYYESQRYADKVVIK